MAEQIRTAAAAEGQDFNNYAVAKLQEVFRTDAGEEEPDDDLLDVFRQGIADEDAGRVLTLEQVDARVCATLTRHNAAKTSRSFAG